jgi:hypothetical protein
MALALQNPKPNTLRRIAQFAKARGLSPATALDQAGFAAGLPLAQRGGKSATAAFKNFFFVGKKGKKGKFAKGSFGKAGSRGGPISRTAVRQIEHAYESRFGKVSRTSAKKGRIVGMSTESALRHRVRTAAKAAYRKSNGGKAGKAFSKTAVAKAIKTASDTQLRAMAAKAGVSGIIKAQEKSRSTKAKQRANAEKLRASGKLLQVPPKRGGVRSSAAPRPSTGKKSDRYRGAKGQFKSFAADELALYAKENRGRRKSKARRNALALQNPRALRNALALENNSLAVVQGFAVGYALPLAAGGALGAVLQGAMSALDFEYKLIEGAGKIPVVGEYAARVIEFAPHTTQGVIAGAGFLLIASFLPAGTLRTGAVAAAASTITVGAALDTFAGVLPWMQDKLASTDAPVTETLESSDLGALALENVSALGALALENGLALQNYGDGFAWELGRLGASQHNLGAADYEQALVADAYHTAHDFSHDEGLALANGREVWMRTFGSPPRRAVLQAGQASHLAGQPGHQWGWLIQTLGYEGAQRLCGLPPQQRVSIIKGLKDAAKQAYQRMTLEQQAMAAESAPAPLEFVPAAGMGAQGASGPGGVSMGASYLGDPNVFASA